MQNDSSQVELHKGRLLFLSGIVATVFIYSFFDGLIAVSAFALALIVLMSVFNITGSYISQRIQSMVSKLPNRLYGVVMAVFYLLKVILLLAAGAFFYHQFQTDRDAMIVPLILMAGIILVTSYRYFLALREHD